jgi:hypothetical protein
MYIFFPSSQRPEKAEYVNYRVRVHPEGFFWEKAQGERISEQDPSPPSPTSASLRPPSYVSDDGVSYIVNAIPPSQEDTLPPHPSETGRF